VARTVALLDANVLYPARLRDLLIRLAIAGVYQARWSEQILDECFRNLREDRPDLTDAQLSRTRRLMTTALPDAVVTGYEDRSVEHDLPDPDDHHVLAAAATAQATLLVTANLKDFPDDKIPVGLVVVSPDEFVCRLTDDDLDTVVGVIEAQAAALTNPPMTAGELLDGLEAVGLTASVGRIRAVR
jgi:predicted nucleic acid-binding protein